MGGTHVDRPGDLTDAALFLPPLLHGSIFGGFDQSKWLPQAELVNAAPNHKQDAREQNISGKDCGKEVEGMSRKEVQVDRTASQHVPDARAGQIAHDILF